MKTQIPWLRVFVEGVVIVASILLAFGIEAWWEGVQERQEEQEALRGLASDFAINIALRVWKQSLIVRLSQPCSSVS